MPKVCILAPVPPPAGGIGAWTIRMMNASLKNGWKVVVVDEQVFGGRTNFGSTSKAHLSTEIRRCFRIWKNLWKQLKDPEVRVVQSCVPVGMGSLARESVCRFLTHITGKKFIIHFRCTVPNMIHNNLHQRMLKGFVSKCDCVMLLNDQSHRYLRNLCPNQDYRVIPNFVDQDEIVCRSKVKDTIETALYVGGVIEEKGCSLIIESAKLLPHVQFRLVGKVGMETNGISENVVLCGELPKNRVREELENADVFLFLTHFWGEGFSNALAEAMAASLPCIVTDWAANADMIENKGGVIVNPTPEAVKNAFEMMANPQRRLEMGTWNSLKVRQSYSEKIVTEQYVDVYDSITK